MGLGVLIAILKTIELRSEDPRVNAGLAGLKACATSTRIGGPAVYSNSNVP
jgi:hypothetical protein